MATVQPEQIIFVVRPAPHGSHRAARDHLALVDDSHRIALREEVLNVAPVRFYRRRAFAQRDAVLDFAPRRFFAILGCVAVRLRRAQQFVFHSQQDTPRGFS